MSNPDNTLPKCPKCGREMNGPWCRWDCDLKLYDCNVCRDFQGNFPDDRGPTDAQPWQPDCWIHQYRWSKPRCSERIRGGVSRRSLAAGAEDLQPRCELVDGHTGPCRYVFMEAE